MPKQQMLNHNKNHQIRPKCCQDWWHIEDFRWVFVYWGRFASFQSSPLLNFLFQKRSMRLVIAPWADLSLLVSMIKQYKTKHIKLQYCQIQVQFQVIFETKSKLIFLGLGRRPRK